MKRKKKRLFRLCVFLAHACLDQPRPGGLVLPSGEGPELQREWWRFRLPKLHLQTENEQRLSVNCRKNDGCVSGMNASLGQIVERWFENAGDCFALCVVRTRTMNLTRSPPTTNQCVKLKTQGHRKWGLISTCYPFPKKCFKFHWLRHVLTAFIRANNKRSRSITLEREPNTKRGTSIWIDWHIAPGEA